jgi:hypothetical protein
LTRGDRPPLPAPAYVLCALLMLWGPVQFATRFSIGLTALATRGVPLAIFLAGHAGVTAVGFAAGRALIDRRATAVRLATIAILLAAALDIVVYGTNVYPASLMPGDAPLYLTAALAHNAAWLLYLARSRRLRGVLRE